jgi:peptide/nickel transport system ATP-binding protein/oligopeptide transport system ATP-binding protein
MNINTAAGWKERRMSSVLLDVQNLRKYFPQKSGVTRRVTSWVKAVEEVSFQIFPGETLGLVGESGCGKTTVGRTILNLISPDAGRAVFEGNNIYDLTPADLKKTRRDMQIIFQDPFASLDPRFTVGSSVGEGLKIHGLGNPRERYEKVCDALEKVGLEKSHADRYPHEFSGGQRQRIGIARALVLEPKLIVCDEPVSALDVSIQSQVINLLRSLQNSMGLSYLFIAHDLSVVEHISDRVAVMYLGRIVEIAEKKELFSRPLHPYTQALLSAVPVPEPGKKKKRIILKGDVPSPSNRPPGCAFHPRCSKATGECSANTPVLEDAGNNHLAACFHK